mgnify:CR=1 FL=1
MLKAGLVASAENLTMQKSVHFANNKIPTERLPDQILLFFDFSLQGFGFLHVGCDFV